MATSHPPPSAAAPPQTTTTTTPPKDAADQDQEDPFDTLLTLEDQFYTLGHAQGTADGALAGRVEGRQLGLERGFQKFVEAGRLQGRAIVWANRLRAAGFGSSAAAAAAAAGGLNAAESGGGKHDGEGQARGEVVLGDGGGAGRGNGEGRGSSAADGSSSGNAEGLLDGEQQKLSLPPLPYKDTARLEKHIRTLYALVETESLSMENTDEAVDDFDDRLRRAQGRVKVIERMVGEGEKEKAGAKGEGGGSGGHDPGSAGLDV